MREFVERNGHTWTTGDQDKAAEIIEDKFAAWVAERIS
jgi:hypothetical protein